MDKTGQLKLLAIVMIIVGAGARLLPHPANFAPIGALALFGGAYLPKRWAFLLPITAMALSDIVIGFDRATVAYVYGSFLLSGLLGIWIKDDKTVGRIAGATLSGSILFFVITNFGVWMDPHAGYASNLQGLIDCYVAAIPFFRNTLLGDLTYVAVFFGAFELSQRLSHRYLPARLANLLA